jgi:adenylate cyclase
MASSLPVSNLYFRGEPFADAQHYIRIYRGDGSYSVMAFPITTTTAEIISVLSGAADAAPGKKVATNMRLYLRAGGQGELI